MSDVLPTNDSLTPDPGARPPCAERAAPIAQVAQPILAQRLHKVLRLVARCARTPDADPDTIHDLRVAIRRGDAALRTFRPLLPERRARRLRKRLRQLRRDAGSVRDIDVLHERLARRELSAVSAQTLDELQSERRRRLRQLQKTARRQLSRRLKRRARQVLRRVRWHDDVAQPTLAIAAAALLQPIAARCRHAAVADLRNVQHLHTFRVSVKRLRYACEFLRAGLDDDAANRLLVQLAELQQRLGAVCDHASAIRLLAEHQHLRPHVPPAAALAQILQHERDALAEQQAELVAWWNSTGRDALTGAIAAALASSDLGPPTSDL